VPHEARVLLLLMDVLEDSPGVMQEDSTGAAAAFREDSPEGSGEAVPAGPDPWEDSTAAVSDAVAAATAAVPGVTDRDGVG